MSSRKSSKDEYDQFMGRLNELATQSSSLPGRTAQDRRRDERALERINRKEGEALRYHRHKKDPPRVSFEDQISGQEDEKSTRLEEPDRYELDLRSRLRPRRGDDELAEERDRSKLNSCPRRKHRHGAGDLPEERDRSKLNSRPRRKRQRGNDELPRERDRSKLNSRPRPSRRGQGKLFEQLEQSKSPPLEDVARFSFGQDDEEPCARSVLPVTGPLDVPPPSRAGALSVRTESSLSTTSASPPRERVDVGMFKDGSVTHVTLCDSGANWPSDFGSNNSDFIGGLISQIGNEGADGNLVDETSIKFLLAFMQAKDPRAAIDAIVRENIGAVHVAARRHAHRMEHAATERDRDFSERAHYRLTGRLGNLVETWNRLNAQDQNKMASQVSVSQAIVQNNVNFAAGDSHGENDNKN